jgi:anti-anti-sigma factor
VPASPTLSVEEIQLSNRLRVVVAEGELDIATVGELRDPVADALEGSAVILDLSGLEFIDSMGLWTLVRLCKRALKSGYRFAIVHGSHSQVERIFELTDLDRHLPLFSSLEEALESFGPGAAP